MMNNGQIYPEDVVDGKPSEDTPELPITACPNGRFWWVFRHVGLNQEHVHHGELMIYSNCLAIIDAEGEWVAVYPSSTYRAYRKETDDDMG